MGPDRRRDGTPVLPSPAARRPTGRRSARRRTRSARVAALSNPASRPGSTSLPVPAGTRVVIVRPRSVTNSTGIGVNGEADAPLPMPASLLPSGTDFALPKPTRQTRSARQLGEAGEVRADAPCRVGTIAVRGVRHHALPSTTAAARSGKAESADRRRRLQSSCRRGQCRETGSTQCQRTAANRKAAMAMIAIPTAISPISGARNSAM